MSLRNYVAGTAVGIVPGLAGTVLLADSFAEAESWSDLLTPDVLLTAALLLGVVVAAATVARRTLAAAEVDAVSVSSQGPSGS